METKKFVSRPSLDYITIDQFLPNKSQINQETSIKKIGANEYHKRNGTFKIITSTRFPEKSLSNLDLIQEMACTSNQNERSDD
jgi:hypothetical protein